MKNDTADRELRMTRTLNAPVELVWEVWTNPEHIKNWWGPNGFTNTIHEMQLKNEGEWNLTMHGPDGTDYKNKSVFREIIKNKKIVYEHISGPKFTATITFEKQGDKTQIEWVMLFPTKEELIQTVKTFNAKEGLKQNLGKLESYISTQKRLYSELKPKNTARVTSYLNFPGTTEEAFNFYKKVFRSEFNGGMKRFGDIPPDPNHPPAPEEIKKLIIHVELPILGGHILMATDAPESMGFKMIHGNNMHINLEPESKEETTRLFKELSEGGNVTMELQDLFWGSYYGSCTDKYGVNWMFNYVG